MPQLLERFPAKPRGKHSVEHFESYVVPVCAESVSPEVKPLDINLVSCSFGVAGEVTLVERAGIFRLQARFFIADGEASRYYLQLKP